MIGLVLTPVANEFAFKAPFLKLGQNIGLLVGSVFWDVGSNVWGCHFQIESRHRRQLLPGPGLPETRRSNMRHRPIILGVQGLTDTFVVLRMPSDPPVVRLLNQEIFETIYHEFQVVCPLLLRELVDLKLWNDNMKDRTTALSGRSLRHPQTLR